MFDENLIASLEQTLQKTREAQNRLIAQLRDKESEVESLRADVRTLEECAEQTERMIHSVLVATRAGDRPTSLSIVDEDTEDGNAVSLPHARTANIMEMPTRSFPRDNTVAYINHGRNGGPPPIRPGYEPLSNRFSDRTITQACTLLLREANKPLHVNELYNLLTAGGMKFKGNNPTISVAVSLSRNRRFRKVNPGTFDLVIREAQQKAS
jgi:hypothetical protein